MRDRLVGALVGLTILVIVLYGVPRAYVLANLVSTQEQSKVTRSADLVALLVAEREAGGDVVDETFLAQVLRQDEGLVYVDPRGERFAVGFEWQDEDDLKEVRQVVGGGELTFVRSGALVQSRISDALMSLVVIGFLLVAAAILVGWILARRLAGPFVELAAAAEQIGRGRFDLEIPHYRVEEAEAIGSALRLSAGQLDDLLAREREFAANASHQLRTPITALRLTLEDLSMWPQVPQDVADELGAALPELDRLSSAIDELLGMSRGQRLGERCDVDLAELLRRTAERWRPHVEGAGRMLTVDAPGAVVGHTVAGPVEQVLDVLVENATAHGEGEVRLGLVEREGYLVVSVGDQGAAPVGREVFERGARSAGSGGHGLGLTIASQLATALGGHLALEDRETTTFHLVLPARDEAAAPVEG